MIKVKERLIKYANNVRCYRHKMLIYICSLKRAINAIFVSANARYYIYIHFKGLENVRKEFVICIFTYPLLLNEIPYLSNSSKACSTSLQVNNWLRCLFVNYCSRIMVSHYVIKMKREMICRLLILMSIK